MIDKENRKREGEIQRVIEKDREKVGERERGGEGVREKGIDEE